MSIRCSSEESPCLFISAGPLHRHEPDHEHGEARRGDDAKQVPEDEVLVFEPPLFLVRVGEDPVAVPDDQDHAHDHAEDDGCVADAFWAGAEQF